MSAGGMGGGSAELREHSVGEILTGAFEIYRGNWAALMQVVAIVAIPLSLIGYLIADQLIRTVTVVGPVTGSTTVVVSGGSFWRASLASALLLFIGVLIAQVLTGAITRGAAGIFVGNQITVAGAYSFGMARVWSILLVSILVGVIVGIGFVLLVIPGFIFLTWLAVSMPALVVEDRRGTQALSRSWELVRGRSWPVFGTLVVAAIITGVVNSIITAPFGHNWFVRGLLAGIATTVTTPFTALVGVLIYLDLRVRKEHLDDTALRSDLARTEP
jgi:hypothetical protein